MASGSANVRLFLRAADQRLEDAAVLLNGRRGTGAVYLAGYAVECGLKALLLSAVPARREAALMETFRGTAAHDYEALRQRYFEKSGARFPPHVVRDFERVARWAVRLRYDPGTTGAGVARPFLASALRLHEFFQDRTR